MALVLTPVSENAARITCTGCPACLVVTARVSADRLAHMIARVELDHRCLAS